MHLLSLVEAADRIGQVGLDHCIRRVDQIGRELFNSAFLLPCSLVQVEVIGLVDGLPLEREYVAAQLELCGEGPEKIFESEGGLADGKVDLCVALVLVLVIVVQMHP